MKLTQSDAVKFINQVGLCLTFPDNNKRDPLSLWFALHPRTPMRWEWDQNGDDRVPDLWVFREELSRSSKVLYAKWYRGRATFISKKMAVALVASLNDMRRPHFGLSRDARDILELLEENSPLSTKQLKKMSSKQGKFWESTFQKALKELWERLLIVGWGEKDDGAFPSLNMASTKLFFEDLWKDATMMTSLEADEFVLEQIKSSPTMLRFYKQLKTKYLKLRK